MFVAVISVYVDRKTKYYITNTQIISPKATLLAQDLVDVRIQKSILGGLRRVGNVNFDSRDGRSLTFRHIGNPERVKETMDNAGIVKSQSFDPE